MKSCLRLCAFVNKRDRCFPFLASYLKAPSFANDGCRMFGGARKRINVGCLAEDFVSNYKFYPHGCYLMHAFLLNLVTCNGNYKRSFSII